MILSPGLVTIRAKDVSLDAPSLFWAGEPDVALAASLAAVGQLVPVVVDMAGRPACLAGLKRVKALRELGLPVRAQALEPDWLGRLQQNPDMAGISRETALGLLYLASNHGAPATDQKLVAAGRYFNHIGALADFVRLGAPLLGLAARDKSFEWLRTWLAFPVETDALITGGHVPLGAAGQLAALGAEGIAALTPYLRLARFSRGNAAQFLTLAREAALAKAVPISEIVRLAGLAAIASRDLAPNDRIAALTGALRTLRYPQLTGLEERFAAAAKQIAKGSKFKLRPSQGFESDGTTIEVTVKSPADVRAAARQLTERADIQEWRDIFNFQMKNKA